MLNQTVLVTGGAGYVGSLLAGSLLREGYRVVVFDTLSFGGAALLHVWSHPNFEFVKGDVSSSKNVQELFAGREVDHVVHLAAIVGDPACAREPERATRVNREGSLNMLEKAMNAGVEKFIYASTCSNYGRMKDPSTYVDEGSKLAPVSLYAELKVQVEKVILQELEKKESFCPVSLRFATVYGVSPRMRFDLTVNEFAKEVALGRELVVYGEQFWRPYCHVADFSRAILRVLAAPREKVAYDVFNVGSTQENYTKSMIVKELQRQVATCRVRRVEKTEDPRDYRVSFSKIESTLGFKVSKTVPEGIREVRQVVDWKIIQDPENARHYNIPH